MGKSVKAQMKYANRIGAKYSMVLGEEELNTGKATVKRMEDGEQIEVNIKDIDTLIKVFK
jgi:histidyl-tRNA synthetase